MPAKFARTMLTPRKIKLAAENSAMRIEWSDGHVSAYPYQYLRDRCPCAMCNEAKPAEPAAVTNPFPMFSKALKPEKAELVGRYAVQIFWNDGHSSGIYAFDTLRGLCPCAECEHTRAESL
jgi:DUF971 family protein